MSVVHEAIPTPLAAYADVPPNLLSESIPDRLPYANLAEWYPAAKSGRPGLIQTVEPASGFDDWDRGHDPEGVYGHLGRVKKLRYLAQTEIGRYLLPQVGVVVHPSRTVYYNAQLSKVHTVQYLDANYFVSALNAVPRPDYPAVPTHAHDYAPRFAIYNGDTYSYEEGIASLATENTLLVANHPKRASHDMLVHAFALFALHRDITNTIFDDVRAAHAARYDDPYGVEQAAADFEKNCTTYALQIIHGTGSKVTALGIEDVTGIPFSEVVAKTIERIDNPLKPYAA